MTLKGIVALTGLCMAGVGCWLFSPAAALIVVGAVLLGVAVFDAIIERGKR